ncbi:hypothetical protein B484DRAFT_255285 [Ochromonadaceae sp. CCMP2298]|nr:hypothetical protein B484DRAFT_255285 [Ochromonadaceae sp. CCMP2298]
MRRSLTINRIIDLQNSAPNLCLKMFSMKFALAVLLVALAFTPASALRSFLNPPQRSFALNIFGVKKLGQSIMGTLVAPIGAPSEVPLLNRPDIGDGYDERGIPLADDAEMHRVLSLVGRSIEQRDLLATLQSGLWGEAQKLEAIRMASTVEDTLPASFSNGVAKTSLAAGGLMEDWDC